MMLSNLIDEWGFQTLPLRYIIAIIIIASSYGFIRKIFKKYKSDKLLKKKRRDLEEKTLSLFQKLQGLKSPFDNIIKCCSLNGSELIKKINSGEILPVDILEAYQANALVNNNELRFISDIIYDADVTALLININDRKNLLGWPLSVSDAFFIEKYDCTQGLKAKILCPNLKTSTVIQVLQKEGAIPFLITNVSQGLQKMETCNPIFGNSLNPYNKIMSCGGCSGGEGAALGSESSLIGIGIDVRGGIRIPALNCGIFGLKPTCKRVSTRYTDKTFFSNFTTMPSIGPMARYIDDLILTFKAMTSERVFEMDPYNPPVQFNESIFLSKKRLKIGCYTYIDGHGRPVPAVERAIILAKISLENAGHEMVEFNLPKTDYIFKLISKAFIIDGNDKLFMEGIKDGPVDKSLLFNYCMFRIPRFIRYILSYLCCIFSKKLGESILESSGSTVFETLKINDLVSDYREEVLSMLEKEGIDGIISPVLPLVAPPLNTCNKLSDINIYCSIYNILDYPAGSVPVTSVSKEDIKNLEKNYKKESSLDKTIWMLQKESLGLPVGVQCVAKPWRDEICLRIMNDIVRNLSK